ncbi:MAG: hypothetical protein IMZ65_00190 [Planctomycetes bacterium]|nr:hypothetical protein [Planctomycetota bacterium]
MTATTNINGQSEPNGILINYYLKAAAQGDVTVKVMQGLRVVAETKGPNAAGMNQVLWNMRMAPGTIPGQTAPAATGRGRPGLGRYGPQARRFDPTFGGTIPAEPGEFTIVVTAGGRTLTKRTQIIEDAWFEKMY